MLTAEKNFKKITTALRSAAVLVLVHGLAQRSLQTSFKALLPSAAAALLLFGASVATAKFRQLFFKYEFMHQDNN
jgi:hypothetical protein